MYKYLAELVGVFVFALSILLTKGAPLTIGAVLALVVYMTKPISGGHINPAVSYMMYLKNALSGMEFAYYTIAQLAGAALALYAYRRY
jgi:aquaporin Z